MSSEKSPERIPNLDPLSPGPMTLSELQSPPKTLQPIDKQTKARRTSRSRAEGTSTTERGYKYSYKFDALRKATKYH